MKRMLVLTSVILAIAVGPVFSSPAENDPAPQGAPVVRDYVIGVEDRLSIVVWGEQDLTMSVQVRPDGKITLPLIDDISVVGLTPQEARDVLTEAFREFVRDPDVTVICEEINSFKVYFLGEVAAQGEIRFHHPVRLIQAIATAGGVTEYSKKQITLLREEYGVEKRISIDYKKLITGNPSQGNIRLKPGDTLVFH